MNLKPTFDPIRKFSFYPELILFISFLVCVLNLNLVAFDLSMSLNLARAFEWLHLNPSSWLGPEVSDFSLRLIGPFYYWLTAALWSLTRSIEGLIFANILISFFCFYFLLRELKKTLSLQAVTLWSLFFLTTPAIFMAIRRLESASLLNALSCLLFLVVVRYEKEKSPRWIWIALTISFFALQIHLSWFAPFLAFMAAAFFNTEEWNLSRSTFFCMLWLLFGMALVPIFKEWTYLIIPTAYLVAEMHQSLFRPRRILNQAFITFSVCLTIVSLWSTLENIWDQAELGRAYSWNESASPVPTEKDSSEMNLKVKKFIYSLTDADGSDPFAKLHGRAINRMRRDEMNPSQTQAHFGLYQSIADRAITYDKNLINKPPDSSWLFQLRNRHEMNLGAESPFLMTEIKPQALPQKTVIKYLDEKSRGLEKMRWTNSNMILPLAFLSHPAKTKIVRLEFEIESQTDKYLNLLMDHEDDYKLLQVKINKKVQKALEHYPGTEAQQNQYVYKIPDQAGQAKVIVEFKILTEEIPNYSRLDIFTSGYLLASEF